MGPEPYTLEIKRMTESELEAFVADVGERKIFLAAHLPPRMRARLLGHVFRPLATGILETLDEETQGHIGMIWERMTDDHRAQLKAGTWPVFNSMRLMHADDWALVVPKLREMLADKGVLT